MSENHDISFTLNGKPVDATVDARLNLADFLRHTLRLTGTHVGCEHGVCGACNVLIDGRSARSCLTLAVQADGASVETIEGLTESKVIADLQREFVARNALQCGFCTPGMLIMARDILRRHSRPDVATVRHELSGQICRCTGYANIIKAIVAAGQEIAQVATSEE